MAILIAENPETLLEAMARSLAASRDPWARHWLVLPGSGRTEWLQRRWARLSGVAAHSQVISLRSLIEQAAAPEGEPFSRVRLALAVARTLPTMSHHPSLPSLGDTHILDARALAWCLQIADAIDAGLLSRPAQNRWGTSFLFELVEQSDVRQALLNHLGMLDQQAFRASASRWVGQWQARGGMPKLWIQLDAGLQGALLRRLVDLLDLVNFQVHLSILSPSADYWGDLRTRRVALDAASAGPILSSLGRQSQDLHNQMIDCFLSEGSGGQMQPALPPPPSLLGLLQQTCRTARVPSDPSTIRDDDWSFTVHSCRSPLRELEVCRDRILQAMSEDLSLGLDDVLVLLADATTHAPLVGAALAPLPVRVVGQVGQVQSQVASGLLRVLHTISSRMGLSDVRALIEEPLVAARFGFDTTDLDPIDWLTQAGFRWGIDAAQREQYQQRSSAQWSLGFALQRLGLGAVVSDAHRDDLVEGAAPLERAAGLNTTQLARLAKFAASLYQAREAWVGRDASELGAARPMHEWCVLLGELCDTFLGDAENTPNEDRTQLVNSIIPALSAAAPQDLLLRGDAVKRLVESSLAALGSNHGSNAGGITVADLRQYAGTPARMILVTGLGSESFPRREDRPAWHPLASNRTLGDPDVREADRHALLLVLLACRERLVLTYQGGSDDDNKLRPPSTPLTDLLAAVDAVATRPSAERAAQAIHVTHGLNGFSPRACAISTRDIARSYLPSDYLGASRLAAADRPFYPGLWSQPLQPPTQLALSFWDLRRLLQEPCQVFVQRLGLRLPEPADVPSENDCLQLDALQRWSLRDRLLQCQISHGDPQRLKARAQAAGELPPGLYGEFAWDRLQQELPRLTEPGLMPIRERIRFALGNRWIDSDVPAGWYQDTHGELVYCTASAHTKKKWFEVLIGLTLVACNRRVAQAKLWFKQARQPLMIRVPQPAALHDSMLELCRLHELAQCLPLPFWCGTYEEMRRREAASDEVSDPVRLRNHLLLQAWSNWSDGNGFVESMQPEAHLPATRACFRGLDNPFTWEPQAIVDWLPEPGTPLAWRLYKGVSEWEANAGELC